LGKIYSLHAFLQSANRRKKESKKERERARDGEKKELNLPDLTVIFIFAKIEHVI